MKFKELILNGESKVLEFKEILPSNEKIAIIITAFSNTAGGKLIIGVDDAGKITGIDDENVFELKDKIASVIFDNCYPNILPEIYTVNVENKLVLVIEVSKGNLPPYFLKNKGKENGTYLRIGATNRKASFENIIELERQRNNISYDEEINRDVAFETLNLAPLHDKFNDLGKPLNQDKLINLKLIKLQSGEVFPTNGLLIVLGFFTHTSVKCAKFKGNTMDIFIDKKEYAKDIFSNFDNTVNFILNHINLRGEINGIQRTDTYEIPLVAIREALVNAFVHRDYTNLGRDIKVGIYDDIVNIVSPGGFPSTITQQDILKGRSEVRNKVLARVFKELNLIEQWGTGIIRILSSCKKHKLKVPAIIEKGDFVDVELYRPTDQEIMIKDHLHVIAADYARLRPITPDYELLNFEEKKLLVYLLDNEKISRKEAVKLLSIGETKTKEIFNGLITKGLLMRKGKGRATFYELNMIS